MDGSRVVSEPRTIIPHGIRRCAHILRQFPASAWCIERMYGLLLCVQPHTFRNAESRVELNYPPAVFPVILNADPMCCPVSAVSVRLLPQSLPLAFYRPGCSRHSLGINDAFSPRYRARFLAQQNAMTRSFPAR